jgi:hypothetical protein
MKKQYSETESSNEEETYNDCITIVIYTNILYIDL